MSFLFQMNVLTLHPSLTLPFSSARCELLRLYINVIYTIFAYCNTYGEFGVPSPLVKVMAEVPDFRYITARTPTALAGPP